MHHTTENKVWPKSLAVRELFLSHEYKISTAKMECVKEIFTLEDTQCPKAFINIIWTFLSKIELGEKCICNVQFPFDPKSQVTKDSVVQEVTGKSKVKSV